jgi:hypothetical protein
MDKTILRLSLVSFLCLFLITSCDKEKEASPLSVDMAKTATLKGYVYAELDKTTAGMENAPEGTKVILTIEYSDLNSSSTGIWKDTVKIESNGTFEVQVPADDDGVTVTVAPLSFEYTQKQEFKNSDESVDMIYTAPSTDVNLVADGFEITQISYTSESFENYVKMVNITGEIVAELITTVNGYEAIPEGTPFILYNDDWSKSYTAGENGDLSATVPANQTIYVDLSFTAMKQINADEKEEYLYELDGYTVGSFSNDTEDVTVNAGEGEKVEQ